MAKKVIKNATSGRLVRDVSDDLAQNITVIGTKVSEIEQNIERIRDDETVSATVRLAMEHLKTQCVKFRCFLSDYIYEPTRELTAFGRLVGSAEVPVRED